MYLRIPKQLHLEITNNCNAKCPLCSRELNPVNSISELTLEDISKAFNGFKFDQINYCGNDGDPLLSKDILKIVKYFEGSFQSIKTNGSSRNKIFWKDLSKINNLEVVFAIDGSTKEIHEKYRINTSFNKILDNAKIFNLNGGKSAWQFICFEHNYHQIEEAKLMAKNLGFSRFEILYSRRQDIKNNYVPIQLIRNKNEVNSINCKYKIREEIYIRSDGEVFPCPYHGEKNKNSGLNIKDTNFKDIVFNSYFDSFNFNNQICDYNCGQKIRNVRSKISL